MAKEPGEEEFAYARVLHRLNPLIRGLLESPLHGLLSRQLMVVSYDGRKTGRRVRFPTGYTVVGGEVVVLISHRAGRSWWRNFREPWPATLRIRGVERSVLGVAPEPGSEAFTRCFEETFRAQPGVAGIFATEFAPESGLTEPQAAALARTRGAVRFSPA